MVASLRFVRPTVRVESISNVLETIRAGGLVVVADDEDRENEGDLFCAADRISADTVNFMLTAARGLLCLSLDAARADALALPPMVQPSDESEPAFTVSIDAATRFGVSSGVSAADRATTIKLAVQPSTVPKDLRRPGHVFPLRAHAGGLAARRGHTEATVELTRLAGCEPGGALIEVLRRDGQMARTPDLIAFCRQNRLLFTTIEALSEFLGLHHSESRSSATRALASVS